MLATLNYIFLSISLALSLPFFLTSVELKKLKKERYPHDVELLKRLNSEWKKKWFEAMNHYLGAFKIESIELNDKGCVDVFDTTLKPNARRDCEASLDKNGRNYKAVLKDEWTNDDSAGWISSIISIIDERHNVEMDNLTEVLKFYEQEKNKSLKHLFETNKLARTPYANDYGDWQRSAIETIALDLGMNLDNEHYRELLTKMGE